MSSAIWVDADACPQEVKELLFRAARRREVRVTLVANTSMRVPSSPWIDTLLVPTGMNMADREIAKRSQPGDLIITADIPLAAEVVARGAVALDPRGELYTDENIGERLALRDLLDQMRGAGQILGGPASLTNNHRQAFANQLDRWIAKTKANGNRPPNVMP